MILFPIGGLLWALTLLVFGVRLAKGHVAVFSLRAFYGITAVALGVVYGLGAIAMLDEEGGFWAAASLVFMGGFVSVPFAVAAWRVGSDSDLLVFNVKTDDVVSSIRGFLHENRLEFFEAKTDFVLAPNRSRFEVWPMFVPLAWLVWDQGQRLLFRNFGQDSNRRELGSQIRMRLEAIPARRFFGLLFAGVGLVLSAGMAFILLQSF